MPLLRYVCVRALSRTVLLVRVKALASAEGKPPTYVVLHDTDRLLATPCSLYECVVDVLPRDDAAWPRTLPEARACGVLVHLSVVRLLSGRAESTIALSPESEGFDGLFDSSGESAVHRGAR